MTGEITFKNSNQEADIREDTNTYVINFETVLSKSGAKIGWVDMEKFVKKQLTLIQFAIPAELDWKNNEVDHQFIPVAAVIDQSAGKSLIEVKPGNNAQLYSDISPQERIMEALTVLKQYQIMEGNPDGTFRPADAITRAEMVKAVLAAQNIHFDQNSVTPAQSSFTDVDSTHWAVPYIETAKGMGIVEGNGDGTFSPENPVTYEEAAKMVMTMLGYAPYAQDKGGYPVGYISAAQRYGVLENIDGFVLGNPATRMNIAIFLYNAVNTPLMDQVGYGGEPSYVILDGSAGTERITLLDRDFT